MGLTDIGNRLTPSVPLEITFGAQPIATGTKKTTLFGHKAATGDTADDYSVHEMTNVGDPDAALAEVDALAGTGSQIGKMAQAFVKANSAKGGTNFPAFRVVFLKYADTDFGTADAALTAVKFLRSDMLVNCYATGSTANLAKLQALCGLLNGVDRDLVGQFGSFITVASIADLAGQEAYAINDKNVIAHALPDSAVTPSQPAEIVAAACAGAMMASAFPYNPLQGVVVGGLIPPAAHADWIDINPAGASEAALVAGLSPLYIKPGNTVAFLRTRTTWTMDGLIPKTAYFDWQDLVVLNDFREVCFVVTQNPPFNNNPGGTKASAQIAALLKDEILREAQGFEDDGAFQAVKSLAPQFLVEPSSTSRGRFDFKIPVNVLPGLYVIAGNIQAVTTFDFTL